MTATWPFKMAVSICVIFDCPYFNCNYLLQFVVMKDENWCQILGQFTSEHFPNINPDYYNMNNIMQFALNVPTKFEFNVDNQGL